MSNTEVLAGEARSPNGRARIEIIQRMDGCFELRRFETRYDSNQDVLYEARRLPNPSGLYSDFESAESEAKRLLAS